MTDQLKTLEEWLRSYGRAWRDHDGEAVSELFTEDATYFWGPFEEPLTGRSAIAQRWNLATGTHGAVDFSARLEGRDQERAFVRWQVDLHPPGQDSAHIDGVFILDMDADGRCRRLQEWFMAQE